MPTPTPDSSSNAECSTPNEQTETGAIAPLRDSPCDIIADRGKGDDVLLKIEGQPVVTDTASARVLADEINSTLNRKPRDFGDDEMVRFDFPEHTVYVHDFDGKLVGAQHEDGDLTAERPCSDDKFDQLRKTAETVETAAYDPEKFEQGVDA